MTDVGALVDTLDAGTLAALCAALDGLDPAARLLAVRGLGKRRQRRLYAVCAEVGQGVGLDWLVPATVPDGATVVFHGKNSLPLFSHFQKRFARMPGLSERLVGYNHQSMAWLTGPGYFRVREHDGTLLFDYLEEPTAAPEGWPTIRPNARGISRLVYAGMHDVCWPVGADTLIGQAFDGPSGKTKGQYFLLTRGDVLA